MNYTATAAGSKSGTVLITANTAIARQQIKFVGNAGAPHLFPLPTTLPFSDILVGQAGSALYLTLYSNGQGPFILNSLTITGDFHIDQNGCTAPVQPNGNCTIWLSFSPTVSGARTGVLTLTDNLLPATQTIALTVNGLSMAPPPTITEIPGIPQVSAGSGHSIVVYGTGFVPSSTILWNGSPRKTYFTTGSTLVADLLDSDVRLLGEAAVTVSTFGPGGGTTAPATATIYGKIPNIQLNQEVYDPHSKLIYATTSPASPTYPNAVIEIDPVLVKVVKTILSGNSPDAIAVSEDGSLLYVELDDLYSVTQVSLPAGTTNFTVALPGASQVPPDSPIPNWSGLAVVPGAPHTWLVSGSAVYDDVILRPVQAITSGGRMVFGSDPTVVYTTMFDPSSFAFARGGVSSLKISASGTALLANIGGGGTILESDGTLIYSGLGDVTDPSSHTVQAKYPQGTGAFALDTANHRLFFGGLKPGAFTTDPYPLTLTAVDQTSAQTLGQIAFQEGWLTRSVERFGANGIFIDASRLDPNGLIFLQTSLTGTPLPLRTAAITPTTLAFGSQQPGTTSAAQVVTLSNTGTAVLAIGAIVTTGDYAATNSCGETLAASAICSISITFTPTTTGDRTGLLNLTDNASAGPQTVSLDGTGILPTLTATAAPSILTFGSQQPGTTSAAQIVMLKNTGTGALTISSIAVTGDYAQTNTCGATLAATASCTVSVLFTPAAIGDRTGLLTITDNAAAGPQTISLDGTGTAPAPQITLAPKTVGGDSIAVAVGSTATYNLLVTTATYSGLVNLACSGAPTNSTCSIIPANPSVIASQGTSFLVSVTTEQTSTGSLNQLWDRGGRQGIPLRMAGLEILTLCSLPMLLLLRRRARGAGMLLFLAMLCALGGIGGIACGGGGNGEGGPKTVTHLTPAGTYMLTVTAVASTQSASEKITLTVQ